ncbi:hypothetical protein PAMC26510_36510 [Caballeronia sordidicola]|uniref:Uncharacterized protein n=1 Tax=Caballeronia sordidicola TaxID=196367 RepID=A0A242M460_CABSO|nr:hypothetical protein PAMC26510_36510 [Caballeronia sordidicola]
MDDLDVVWLDRVLRKISNVECDDSINMPYYARSKHVSII